MSQDRKSLYDLYPRLIDTSTARMRKMLSKGERKRTRFELLREIYLSAPYLLHSLDFFIMAEEYLWEREGHQVIFPESVVVLDNFSKARFQMETSDGFSLPFDSFMLAMPNGYRFMGTALPGLLVTFIDYFKTSEIAIYPFCDALKIPRPTDIGHDNVKPGSRAISISYRDPKNPIGYARMLMAEEKLPAVLKADSIETFAEIMGSYHSKVGVHELEDYDLEIQFKAVRLIAALGVYHLATEGERIKPGFPGPSVPRMNFRNPDTALHMSTLSSHVPSQLPHNTPEAHYRTWYIRQLRDERYYKGDHEHRPRGSRYVFVSESVVGTKATPYTQG